MGSYNRRSAPRGLNRLAPLIPALLAGLAQAGVPTRVLHVKLGGSGTMDGSSWANACESIEAARVLLDAGPISYDEIWVTGGTYRVTHQFTGCVDDQALRSESLVLPDGVALRGGFIGTESSTDARPAIDSPDAPVTIITGDLNCDDGDHWTTRDDNTFHVIVAVGHTEPIEIDRITVTGGAVGLTDDTVPYAPRGAGLLAEGPGLMIADSTFTGNYVGPCDMSVYDPNVGDISYGAGVSFRLHAATDECDVSLTRCVFQENRIAYPTEFFGSSSSEIVGAYGAGFGMTQEQDFPLSVVVSDCEFTGNSVYSIGNETDSFVEHGARGGAFCYFAPSEGNELRSDRSIDIERCSFSDNVCDMDTEHVVTAIGGALYIAERYNEVDISSLTLSIGACRFTANRSGTQEQSPSPATAPIGLSGPSAGQPFHAVATAFLKTTSLSPAVRFSRTRSSHTECSPRTPRAQAAHSSSEPEQISPAQARSSARIGVSHWS